MDPSKFQHFGQFLIAIDGSGLRFQKKARGAPTGNLESRRCCFTAANFDAWNYDSDAPVSLKVKASYDKIAQESAKARDAFNPFLASLADMKKLVAMDITGLGIFGTRFKRIS